LPEHVFTVNYKGLFWKRIPDYKYTKKDKKISAWF
jgi:hypothetical protein